MKRIFAALCLCLLFSATEAAGGGFALYEWSNRGLAMGTTGYAVGNDASVIATNPSLMTELKGKRALAGVTFISPQATVTVNGVKNKTKANIFAVPHAYYTQQMESNDKVWLGVGMFTRFGLGTEYDDDWSGRAYLQYVDLESTSITPTIAFKFSDDFSLALGLEVLRGSISLKRTVGAASVVSANTEGYAAGGNISMHYNLDKQWTLGFIWRAPMTIHTSGSGQNDVYGTSTKRNQDIEATLPGSYTLGIGYKPTDRFNLEFDVVHTRWDSVDAMKYSGVINYKDELYYKNTWRFQIGAEYWLVDWLALRAGYVYDQTPTRGDHTSFMLPANDRRLFSGGLGFKWGDWTADLSGMYITNKDRKNVTVKSPGLPNVRADYKNGMTWATGVSFGYTF